MTARDLAKVLLRVTGVYWIVSRISSFPGLVVLLEWPRATAPFDGGPSQLGLMLASLVNTLVMLGIAIFLLVKTEAVLGWFFKDLGEAGAPLTSFSVQAIAFSVVGLYLLASGARGVVSSAVILLDLSRLGRETQRAAWVETNWTQLLQQAVQTGVGLGLFLGGRGLAALWHRLRPMSYRQPRH